MERSGQLASLVKFHCKTSSVKTCVIFNPAARGEKARRFRRHLDQIGAQATLKLTAAAGDARRLAAEAVAEGFDTVVAAGGDGTVNEVLNGLGDVPDGFKRARLGVLPLGTVNVFALELALPLSLPGAWAAICQGNETQIDLPRAEFVSDGVTHTRYFVQLAGAGLDARAVELVQWELKKKMGYLAYVVAALQALRGQPSEILLEVNGREVKAALVLVGNGRFYGGRFRVFPRADLRDGMLDVCVFPKVNWLTVARCSPLLWRGSLPTSMVHTFQAQTLALRSNIRVPLEVDGELIGQLPATFYCARGGLRVAVP